jgi:steroid delta-isomerase-like uncharacterized protein
MGPRLDTEFLDEFAQRWLDAWNRRDGHALAALCTPDVEFHDPAIGTVHGREAVADWVLACATGFPDFRFEDIELPYPARDRPKAIVPWRMTGTNTGPLDPPGFAPTGRSIVIEGVDHWWFRGDLVARYRADYDLNDVMRQLHLAPAPGSAAEKAFVGAQRLAHRAKEMASRN